MMHKRRTWCVSPIASAEDLAEKLTEHSWCLCAGFELDGYWFLNDATGENGAQEYAVVKINGHEGRPLQVESITMSWCSYEQALRCIRQAISGQYDKLSFASTVSPAIETPERHGRCPLCA